MRFLHASAHLLLTKCVVSFSDQMQSALSRRTLAHFRSTLLVAFASNLVMLRALQVALLMTRIFSFFFFFKVPRNWTSVGLQQDPHETIGNGLNTVTESPLQVSAASRRYTTRGDERGLCFCQRLWGEKSHELFCQWSFPRLRTKDRSCHLGLAQKNYNQVNQHSIYIYIYIY